LGAIKSGDINQQVALRLEYLVRGIIDFEEWKHEEKIKLFAWFLHEHVGKKWFAPIDIDNCYHVLNIPKTNSSEYLKVLRKRKPPEIMKDGWNAHRLARRVRERFEGLYGGPTNPLTSLEPCWLCRS
jgi:hypothetical protein